MTKDSDSSSLVRLNVGGKEFCTYMDTLTGHEPNSMLAAMFSGRHTLCQDDKGCVFIDRDGEYFGYILNWLRDGDVPALQDFKYSQLLKEAQYFQLEGLIDGIHALLKEKKKLGTDLTRSDFIKYRLYHKRGAKQKFKGVNLSGLDLSGLDLCNMDFTYACIRNVCFSNAFLSNSYFDNADAEGADFNHAFLGRSTFFEANLRGANFDNANLGTSVFTGAILQGASAVGAVHEYLTNFGGASLSSAARVDGCTECAAGRWRYCTECTGASMQAEF